MSVTTILGVIPDNRPAELLRLRNGYGWSPSIWGRLLEHRGEGRHWTGNDAGLDRLWQEIETLPEWQQAPLVLTFDTGVIPRGAYRWAAEQLQEFERQLPEHPDRVNHVPAVAALFEANPSAPFVGAWGTSVTDNPFDPWDDEADDYGSGVALSDCYLLERHRHILAAGGMS